MPAKLFVKILSKVISICLKLVQGDQANNYQSGFITGRPIIYVAVISQRANHYCHTRSTTSYLLKFDYKKAYDKVDWDCLL